MHKTTKTIIAVLGFLVLGLTVGFAIPEWFHGYGTGECYYYHDGEVDTIEVFYAWQLETDNHPPYTNGFSGCTWDLNEKGACLTATILRGNGDCEYEGGGLWELYNPIVNDNGGDDYDGTFTVCIDSINATTWSLTGAWQDTRDSLIGFGAFSGHGHFSEPDGWSSCASCPVNDP